MKSCLIVNALGIDTQHQPIVYLSKTSPWSTVKGFKSRTRVKVEGPDGNLVPAIVNLVSSGLLKDNELGLSDCVQCALDVSAGDEVSLNYASPVDSLSDVRAKIYGESLNREQIFSIVRDIAAGRYLDVHLAAFVTACAGKSLSRDEVHHLTAAMVDVGNRIDWSEPNVVDKHCVGGLPGNRTTPIVVAIVACSGLKMPKTSSRAITSPAGTADTMETITNVSLSLDEMKSMVHHYGATLAWGGAVSLSPADDILIKVERLLDLDSEGQLIASVLSKKIAAGSKMIVIDVPVGATAKVRTMAAATELAQSFEYVATQLGVQIKTIYSDGSQPVGRGIGPALEAVDVLNVLRCKPESPLDLRQRSVELAGALFELAGKAESGEGAVLAESYLDSGQAWEKFRQLCFAQGGFNEPVPGRFIKAIAADKEGKITSMNNRIIARVAKLAGAPFAAGAGILMNCRVGDIVKSGDELFYIYAESEDSLTLAANRAIKKLSAMIVIASA